MSVARGEGRGPRGWGTALAIITVTTLLRIAVGALTPLFPDETYYWEWSRRLAAGYFDHPPGIAWLIRLGTLIAGETPLGVRLLPALVGGLGVLLAAAAARIVAGDRAALLVAAAFAVMPLSAAGLILATPDAPLLAAVAAVTYALVRALEHPARSRGALGWWCVAGAALGLGLASKYTAVLLAIGVFIALLTRRDIRARLAEPGPYFATLIALLLFLPVILWNAAHDWASFGFQLQHGLGGARGSWINRELEMIGGQLGLVSPILFVMCALAVAGAMRSGSVSAPATSRVLAVAALFVFAFFMYSATRRRVEGNWPAIAYVPGMVVLAARAWTPRWRGWLRGGLAFSAILSAIAYVNAFTPILPVPARRDPAARAHGWEVLARAVDRIHGPRRTISSYRTWIAADRYQEASEIAFHLPDHPETFALNISTRPNQYDLWPGFPQRAYARDAMVLVVDDVEGTHATVTTLEPHFTTVRRGDSVTIARRGDATKHLRIWVLDGWRGTWPERPLRSR